MSVSKTELTVEQIIAALRVCGRGVFAREDCKECCLMGMWDRDFTLSDGQPCFDHLDLAAADALERLNDFQSSQCAKLLVELGKVRKVLEACRLEEWEAFTGPERMLVIAKEKAMCEFCVDYGNGDACIKCPRAKGVTHGELKRFHRAIIRLLEAVMEAQP